MTATEYTLVVILIVENLALLASGLRWFEHEQQ